MTMQQGVPNRILFEYPPILDSHAVHEDSGSMTAGPSAGHMGSMSAGSSDGHMGSLTDGSSAGHVDSLTDGPSAGPVGSLTDGSVDDASDDTNASTLPDNHYTLDEFKVDVRTWIELDDSIKSLQNAIKERRCAKKQLTDRITEFMNTNEIEDLITKNGRIRYKTNYVKSPLSHTDIKNRISDFFQSDENSAKQLVSMVFGLRGRSEKPSLRRMKISGTSS